MDRFITREEAIETLVNLVNSGILDEELENNLEEIISCIDYERKGYHAWGADCEFTDLFIAYRSDLWTDELKERMQKLHNKYSFTPASYEQEEINDEE